MASGGNAFGIDSARDAGPFRSRHVGNFPALPASVFDGMVLPRVRVVAGHSSASAGEFAGGVGVESTDGFAAAVSNVRICLAGAVRDSRTLSANDFLTRGMDSSAVCRDYFVRHRKEYSGSSLSNAGARSVVAFLTKISEEI